MTPCSSVASTPFLVALNDAACLIACCHACLRVGPAAALDGPLEPLHEAARAHLAEAHPEAAGDAYGTEPCGVGATPLPAC
ncbi:hypothetical protein ACFY7C_36340 [Streptomyces sp. NPDC012769]|uniref:hypothetical protein n=1 Tax=Streptomyces sp. NPDC012769 TaxID=3364848 RepID=UPI003694B954